MDKTEELAREIQACMELMKSAPFNNPDAQLHLNEAALELAQMVIERNGISPINGVLDDAKTVYVGIDYAKEYLDEVREQARQEQKEKVARWMLDSGYATGHGDTIDDLLKELEWQIKS